MTREQINESARNRAKAVKYFEWVGLLPKDRKPYEYCLHHIDESLRHNDVDRYIKWYGYDLVVELYGEHSSHTNKGRVHTEEARRHNSEAQKGKHLSDETKLKLSLAFRGSKNPMYSKSSFTNKTKEEMMLIKQKMSDAHKGITLSEDTRKKISEAKKGQPSHTMGTYWWNNGVINKRCKECPGGEWRPGRLSQKENHNGKN